MKPPLRVLLVEDSEDDAMLILRALRRSGIDCSALRVQDATALAAALAQPWDIVISDYSMRGFTGMDALASCRAVHADMPFILMSGTIGEETAVMAMKAGANDYVMKHNMARLAPAVLRELLDATMRAELRRTELKLIESERRFHAFMDASPFIASIKDDSGRYVYRNHGWNKLFGLEGPAWCDIEESQLPHERRAAVRASDIEILASGIAAETVEEIRLPDTEPSYWKNTRFPFFGASGQRLLGELSTDITALKHSEETIRKLAYLDPLTELPNRRLMLERLANAVGSSARSQSYGALLFVDLDDFKIVNDAHGHDAGDLLLQQTAQRLNGCVRVQDTVSRTGGDEFIIILEGLSNHADEAATQVDAIARKMLAVIEVPYLLGSVEQALTASSGITLFCSERHTPTELMKRADLALYSVKKSGRNRHVFFDPAMQARVSHRNAMEADLRRGLEKHQFVLFYQPQVDSDGWLTGVEALLRLQHPQKGLVMPASFIALAEETGLIIELGYWALDAACAQLLAWSADPVSASLTISVNVSARQFSHPDFVVRVVTMLERSGADPGKLILELTESLLLEEVDLTIQKMTQLRQTGLRFSLDDFGTGYSSLSYLKLLPLHEIKIDRTFVRDILHDENDAVIVRAIVALGHSFGLSIIAEGVENVAQRDFLVAAGCRRFQGYFFGRPVPVELLSMSTRRAK